MTKELLNSITTRSEMLSRRYYFLEKEDLLQEGHIFLLDLETKDLSLLQKHKAINNLYANLERHALYQQKIERNASSFGLEVDSVDGMENPEESLSREQITNQLLLKLTKKELLVLEWLSSGLTFEQIAELMCFEPDHIRRVAMRIIKKRTKLEEGGD
jgi:hypothetical protein